MREDHYDLYGDPEMKRQALERHAGTSATSHPPFIPPSKCDETTAVSNPAHYNYGKIEVIDFIDQVCSVYPGHEAFHVANIIKYLARAPLKGNKKQDLEKAEDYMRRLMAKQSDQLEISL